MPLDVLGLQSIEGKKMMSDFAVLKKNAFEKNVHLVKLKIFN